MDNTSNFNVLEGKDFEEFYTFYKSSPSERLLLHETLFGANTNHIFTPAENIYTDTHLTHFSDVQNFEKNVSQIPKSREYVSRFWGSKNQLNTVQEPTDESFENNLFEVKGSHESGDICQSSTNVGDGNDVAKRNIRANNQNESLSTSFIQEIEDQTGGPETVLSDDSFPPMTSWETPCCQRIKFESQSNDDTANPQQNHTDKRNWNLEDVIEEFERSYIYQDNEAPDLTYRQQPCNMRMYEELEQFAIANEFEIEDPAPNGNCMFQAIRDQLAMKGDFRFTALCLRQKAVDYLREHPTNLDGTHLQMFLPKDESWHSYLSKMSLPGQWGDNLTLMALSKCLARHIVVVSVGCNGNICQHEFSPKRNSPETNKFRLYLGHLQESHYVSLRHASWKKTWPQNAKILRQAEMNVSKMTNPGEQLHDIPVQESLRLMSDFVDPISGIPMPHLSFVLKNLIEEYHFRPLIRPFPLSIREEYEDSFYSISVGGKSDGTDVILEPKANLSIPANDFDMTEQCSTALMVCKRYKVCEGGMKKDMPEMIITETDQTHAGYCRLRRGHFHESIGCWHCSCDQCKTYLKGWKPIDFDPDDPISVRLGNKVFPAYECPRLPTSTNEWRLRKTYTGWPLPELKEKIQKAGCHIVRRAHPLSTQPDVEWQFVFSEAEKILFASGLSVGQKYVYKALKVLVDFYSRHLKVRLHTVHIKSVFFFACEQIEEAMFDVSPGSCLLFVLENIIEHLQNHNLPNYFIKQNNLIDHFKKVDVEQLKSAVETIRLFPFQSIAFMMSSIGHRRSWIVDIVSQDFEKYALDKDMDRVSRKLFFPTSIMLARKLAYEKEFDQAYAKIRDAELELIMSAEKENGQIDRVPDIKVILQEVVNSCDKETRSDFTSFIEDKIKCPLFDIYRKSKRVRDIMNKDDANEYANKMVPKDCVDNIHAEARFLNGIGCELQNEKRNIRAATKFFAAAIDLLETQIDETENFAVVDDEDLRRKISPQKYQSLSNIYQALHVYYRNLFNAYTILWETDQMHKRMKGLERVSRNLALQDLVDYVACIGNILGGTEKRISLTYDR